MSLVSGSRIGVYEIIGLLGAGGMGEVYRAHDTRLDRDVAIKVLPERSTGNRDAVARLQAEARTASALNHPNILTIYDVGVIDSDPPRDYIAMEYIDGETLRERLGGPREQEPLLDILMQVAAGLAKAHEASIIHRDLKPENIMITGDGYAKILDFGLAKLLSAEFDARAQTQALTAEGRVVGTIGYMAPEQLSGHAADARVDIFAFGCILYESLAGHRPYPTIEELFSGTVPPLTAPLELQRIVSRCIARDPARRYGSMKEVIADLRRRRAPRERAPLKLTQLTFDKHVEQYPAISRDGARVIYSREAGKVRNLFMTTVGAGHDQQITSGEFDDLQPAWSPDGEAVLFVRAKEPHSRIESSDVFGRYLGGDIWRLELSTLKTGGKATLLINDAANPSWSPDGTRIAYDASRGGPHRIWIADARGRNPQQLSSDDTDAAHHVRPRWSPDGRHVVFQTFEGTKFDVRVASVESRRSHAVTDDYTMDIHPVWSPDGEWIFFSSYRSGGINVWRMPVDRDGVPLGAMEQVTAGPGHDVDLDIAPNGRLVFAILKQNADIWRLPVDPQSGAAMGPAEEVIATTRENSRGAWAPDGRSIAFSSDRGGEMNLWLMTVADGLTRQLTRGGGGDFQPNWSPDGKNLVFFSGRSGTLDLWRIGLDGSSEPERLTKGQGININPFYSPDGTKIAFMSDRDGHLEVWVMNSDGSAERRLTTVGVIGHFLRWSPDGTRIYFRCPTGSKARTMTVSLAGGDPEPTAEVAGGAHMSLSPDESLVMDVVAHRTLWVSPLNGEPPRKVFEFDDPESRIDYPVWSPDGRWILFDRFVPHGGDVWMVEM